MERSLNLNVPVWMGEGGADQVSNAIFLQLLEEENIGYSLWCWKTSHKHSDDVMPEDTSPAEHGFPEDWEMVHDYADHGGPRPGYAKSQKIFDEYLDLLDYDKCTHPDLRHQYNLRQPGITIPAVGYDHGEFGKAFSGKWNYGNAFQFRESDHMKMIVKPGGLRPGPKGLWPFTGYGLLNMPRAVDSLWLELQEGEFVHYTVKDVRDGCRVVLRLRCDNPCCIQVSNAAETRDIPLDPSEELIEKEVMTLSPGDEYRIRVEALTGTIQLADVLFAV